MMIKKIFAPVITGILVLAFGTGALAAFDQQVELAYNTAVQGQDALDGLDVSVSELTVSSLTNIISMKDVDLQVSGIRSKALSADITVSSDETSSQSYYRNGYFYETTSKGNIKSEMDRDTIWSTINSNIYLDMTSNYLKLLYAQDGINNTVIYTFAGTEETLTDYKTRLLDEYSIQHGAVIDSLQGTMTVDADGHVTNRVIRMVYSIGKGDDQETFYKSVNAVFSQNGIVTVSLPDLSSYKTLAETEPAVTITPKTGTVYVTADSNVRAAGSLDAAVIGGYSRGSGVTRTGVTSDGWVQIQYNGGTGYIWGGLISETKPVFTTDTSGTMYAVADVNIRADHNTDSQILGVLKKGEGIEITGKTDNGWTRVSYKGGRGYIASNYLSWSEPVVEEYVKNGKVTGYVTDASYGSLVIRLSSGQTMFFNTRYASMRISDSLKTGDIVDVTYTGSDSPYTATLVVDNTNHEVMQKVSYTVDGIVTGYSKNLLEMTCSDGMYRSFNLSNASVEVDGGIVPGMYLLVTWMSSTGGSETYNIEAVAVS